MNKLKKLLYVSLCSTLLNLSAYSINYKMLDYAAEDLSGMISDDIPITSKFIADFKLGFIEIEHIDVHQVDWNYTPDLQKTLKTEGYETLLSAQRLERMGQFQMACQEIIDLYQDISPVMQNGVQLLHNRVMQKLDNYALFIKNGRDICEDYRIRQQQKLQLLHKRKVMDDLIGKQNKRQNFDTISPATDESPSLEQVH